MCDQPQGKIWEIQEPKEIQALNLKLKKNNGKGKNVVILNSSIFSLKWGIRKYVLFKADLRFEVVMYTLRSEQNMFIYCSGLFLV